MGSILVVETDLAASPWGSALDGAGHTTQVVTLREALPYAKDGGIDVIVIDANDPRVGITELARGIAGLPDAPPLVLVSNSPHAPEISVRIGAAAFLLKPCEPAELIALISRMTSHTRPVFLVDLDGEGEGDDEPTMMRKLRGVGKIVAS